MNYKYIDIRVIAPSDDDINSFLQLCAIIQELGDLGVCRKIPIVVDGDGSGKFSFYEGIEPGEVISSEKKVTSANIDPDDIKDIWLGE